MREWGFGSRCWFSAWLDGCASVLVIMFSMCSLACGLFDAQLLGFSFTFPDIDDVHRRQSITGYWMFRGSDLYRCSLIIFICLLVFIDFKVEVALACANLRYQVAILTKGSGLQSRSLMFEGLVLQV